jgi:hypothetical protein
VRVVTADVDSGAAAATAAAPSDTTKGRRIKMNLRETAPHPMDAAGKRSDSELDPTGIA